MRDRLGLNNGVLKARGQKILSGILLFLAFAVFGPAFPRPAIAASTDTIRLSIIPRDIWPPRAITDFAVAPNTEGTALLTWTAPYEDTLAIPNQDPVQGYTVRYATFSLTDVGGSTTAWWNLATYNSNFPVGQAQGFTEIKGIGGLEPGATLYFVVRSSDDADNLSELSQASTAQILDNPPAAPTGLTAFYVTESTVSLVWSAPSPNPGDLDHYRLFMSSEVPVLWNSTVTVPASVSTYTFANLTLGVTYQFKVTAVDKGAPSNLGIAYESAESSVTTSILRISSPAAFVSVQAGTDTIIWQWQDNSSVETGYRVYSSSGGLMLSTGAVSGSGSSLQWTEAGLTPNTSYQRYAVAVYGGTESQASNAVSTYTLANPPLNLTASTAAVASITLVWDANNNPAGTRYILERATYPSATFIQVGDLTALTTVNANLAEAATYTYRLSARNGDNLDSSSLQVTTYTTTVAPSAVTSLSALPGPGAGTVLLSWIAPGDDGTSGNIAAGQYDIRWSTDAIASDADFENVPASSSYRREVSTSAAAGSYQSLLLTGLQFETTVYIALKTRDEVAFNFSGLSNVASILRISSPTAFASVQVATDTIVWQWQDNSGVETGYRVYSSSGGLMLSTGAVSGSGSSLQWTEAGLTPNTSYQRYAVAVYGGTESQASNAVSTHTFANPPLNLTASTAAVASITLVWDANNNPAGTRYILERATYPSVAFAQIADLTAATTVSAGLAEAATYTFRLRARNGNNLDSASLQITTFTATVAPAGVTSLAAVPGPAQGSVILNWIAPGDDGTSGDIVAGQYDIRWSTGVIASNADFDNVPASSSYRRLLSTSAAAGSPQSLLLTGLQFNTTIYIALKTRDELADNFSGLSNIATTQVQVDLTSPAVVSNLTAVLLGNTSAQLNWTAPGDDGASGNNTLGSYRVRYRTDGPVSSLALFEGASSASVFGIVPQPGNVGTAQAMILTGLASDVTYYFALRTLDEAGNASGLSNGATLYTTDILAPGPAQNFTAAANHAAGRRIDLAWTNPADADLKGVRILISTTAYALLPSDTTGLTRVDLIRTSTAAAVATSYIHSNLTVGVTYFYSLFAFDDEFTPNFSAGVFASSAPVPTALRPPAKPRNVRGVRSGDGKSMTLSWSPVTARDDGTALDALELSSYSIYRMSLPQGSTNQVFSLAATTSPVLEDGGLSGRTLYYKVRAVNLAGTESEDSDILVSDAENSVIVMMDDNLSFFKLPGDLKNEIEDRCLELHGERDRAREENKTFKHMDFKIKDCSTGETQSLNLLEKPIQISIAYLVDSNGTLSNGAPFHGAPGTMPKAEDAPKAFSIYWNNGAQWIKLGTTIDPGLNLASVQSRHTGAYELRLVQQGLSAQSNTVYPRTITPNGDGINDKVFFFFENPTDAPVKGTIYDLRSAKVGEARRTDIFAGTNTVLTWDGKDEGGAVVTGGLYLYKVEIGDKTFTGTIAVAR